MSSDQNILENLRNELHMHTHLYYVKDAPIISDYEFDLMLKKLIDLESKFPQFFDSNSPTQRVGGEITKNFKTVTHKTRMFSFNSNEYSSLIIFSLNCISSSRISSKVFVSVFIFKSSLIYKLPIFVNLFAF